MEHQHSIEVMESSSESEKIRTRKKVTLPPDKSELSQVTASEDSPLLGSKKHPFPKSVFFIFLNEFCERYSFYGLEAILALFLRNILNYTEVASTVIYHLFVTISYTTPVVGGIFGDSILGKFRTTVYFSIVHSIGSAALAVGALPFLSVSTGTLLTILALIVTAIGIGGIKPSVAAFGGDQFKLPEQNDQLTIYFSIYYLSINFGATLSEIFTPILRKDVECFGQDTCYSLAFAVPAILMVISLAVFIMGKRFYTIKPVSESVTLNTLKCISYAIGNRKEKREMGHWLDYADDKYSNEFIDEIKSLFRVLVLLSPLVIFWSLWTQMGTTWTFQATRMNGYISDYYTIKPDQLQVTNSFLILFLIPIFDIIIYPSLAKCGLLVKPIPRIAFGCFLMTFSFIMAGALELQLAKSYPTFPTEDETTLNLINGLPCKLQIQIEPVFKENPHPDIVSANGVLVVPDLDYNHSLQPYGNIVLTKIPALDYNITVDGTLCKLGNESSSLIFSSVEFLPQAAEIQTFLIESTNGVGRLTASQTHEDLAKSEEANAKTRIIGNVPMYQFYTIQLISSTTNNYSSQFNSKDQETISFEVDPGIYTVVLFPTNQTGIQIGDAKSIGYVSLQTGGSYLIGVFQHPISQDISVHLYVLTKPNVVHMFWQLPQYILLTVAEVLVAVTGYHFAYEQAPLSMKSTLQSVWLLTVAGGNLIIVFIVAFDIFPSEAILFFFFAGLMAIGTVIFIVLGAKYKSRIADDAEYVAPIETSTRMPRRRHSIAETVATGVK